MPAATRLPRWPTLPRGVALPLAATAAAGTGLFIWLADLSGPARVAILAVAVAAHLVLVLCAPDRTALPPAFVLALTLGLVVASVAARPQGTDLWAYQMYGRTVLEHDANPYRQAPSAFPDDPVYQRMDGYWTGTRAEYGPVLVGTSVAVVALTGDGELGGRLAWQGLCGAAVVATVLLVRRRTGSGVAMAAIGLNPLVAYQLVNLAHNDALLGLAVLGGVLLAEDERWVPAALLLTVAALIKAPAGIALVALLLWLLLRRGVVPATRAALAAGTAGLAALAVAGGRDVVEPMLGARGRTNSFTPWNLLRGGEAIFTGDSMPDLPFVASDRLATLALATSVVLGVGVAAVRAWRPAAGDRLPDAEQDAVDEQAGTSAASRVPGPAAAVLGALLVWTFLSLYTSPWSFGWVLPVVALAVRSWLCRAVLAYVACFTVVSQWGIVTVAATWLRQPNAARYDDVNAFGKSVLLVGLLALVAAVVVDAGRRLLAAPPAATGGRSAP